MSGEVHAVPDAIRRAAGSVEEAAAGVGSHVPSELTQVGGALPGSLSAGAADELAATLRGRFRAWERRAEGHAEAMWGSAQAWNETDTAAAAVHRGLAPLGVLGWLP